jgi:hypothetical protein
MTWGSRLTGVVETSDARGLLCCRESSILQAEIIEENLQGICLLSDNSCNVIGVPFVSLCTYDQVFVGVWSN